MTFPMTRMLRYRQSPQIRVMLNEIVLTKSNLIYPIFINENLQEKKAVQKMPGVFQQSPSTLLAEVERIVKLGLNAVLLFGVPTEKDLSGSSSYHSEGVIQNSIAAIK